MKKLKSGKEEIVYLLSRVIEKYTEETGHEIVQNTNRKNYESLAVFLSGISNQLPANSTEWETEAYPPETNTASEYPYRKYDITGGQLKDALNGVVSNPRPFLVDACYVYLYGVGRKGFEQQPTDDHLVEKKNDQGASEAIPTETQEAGLNKRIELLELQNNRKKNRLVFIIVIALFLVQGCLYFLFQSKKHERTLQALKTDMGLLPYQPTQLEIDSLEGIWLCYTGSPQARLSDASRYHKVVPNLVEVVYKDGYFVYNRYGASFDHLGYMQMESPGIVSIYSRIKNNTGAIESPRHSLMDLNKGSGYIAAMSTSWNFDTGKKNRIVGIREIYRKLGKGGSIQEVMNQIENASCQCKIIRWTKPDKTVETFYLKNERLETVLPKDIQPLINEQSILLNEPDSSIILADTNRSKK